MNLVVLKGRLAKDPEVRYTNTGKAVASFSVAVDGFGQNSEAQFFNCSAWEKTAELVGKHFSKGKEILLNGRLQNRSYNAKDGSKRQITEIIVNSVEFCGSKKDNDAGYSQPAQSQQSFGASVDPDEDIPF